MDKNNSMHKSENAIDTTMEQAYQIYGLLNEEVCRWQDERGSFWMAELSSAENPPYFPLEDFPERVVLELWERLNRVREISVPESVLRETWKEFKVGQPVSDPELLSTLQIALIGIANLLRTKAPLHDHPIEPSYRSAVCPVCGETVTLSVITPSNGKRFLHCTFCGQEWPTMRVGCIRCGNEEASKQYYLNSKEFPGVEVVTCEACGQYFKEFDLRLLSVADYVWEDVRTMSLNYAAEQWLAEHAKGSGKTQ
ncbi:MAG: formate dehydrogenase accessory protein FdhE [Desulfosporosinus sp.]|jgi:FdhE protein